MEPSRFYNLPGSFPNLPGKQPKIRVTFPGRWVGGYLPVPPPNREGYLSRHLGYLFLKKTG